MSDKKEQKEKSLGERIAERVKFQKQTNDVVYTIQVEDKFCLLKKPNRSTYETALGLVANVMGGQPQYVTAGLRIMQSCWLEGDDEMLKDDDYLVPAAMQAIQLIEQKGASLKKN